MSRRFLEIMALSLSAIASTAATSDGTASPAAGPALADQLRLVDQHGAAVKTLSAHFQQRKFTALLKKPLVSAGTVRSAGEVVRWDTQTPTPTVLWANGGELRLYYPQQHLEEIYPIDQRLGDLLTSPLPRLKTIEAHFAISRADAAPSAEVASAAGLPPALSDRLALQLSPTDPSLQQHVHDVLVLLNIATGVVEAVRTTDSDGDQTLIAFSDAKLNAPIAPSDLQLTVPPGTTVSHPLEGMGSGSMPASAPSP